MDPGPKKYPNQRLFFALFALLTVKYSPPWLLLSWITTNNQQRMLVISFSAMKRQKAYF